MHVAGPLGEHLETVPAGSLHDRDDAVDPFEADAFRDQHPQLFQDAAAVRQRLQARHEKGPTDDARLADG